MKLIFEKGAPGQHLTLMPACDVPEVELSNPRTEKLELPHVSETELTRHYMALAKRVHGVNDGFYPLGSCTMKYNPKINEDMAALRKAVGPDTVGLMLTNSNTDGIFCENILKITRIVHDAGGLCYYDGANLNAVMGVVRPGDMGFDVIHNGFFKP